MFGYGYGKILFCFCPFIIYYLMSSLAFFRFTLMEQVSGMTVEVSDSTDLTLFDF